MNHEIKQRWVTALRSGDYTQTEGQLSDIDGYCCLGVLCEIAIEDDIVAKTVDDSGDGRYTSKTDFFDQEKSLLPVSVKHWAELDSTNPAFIPPEGLDVNELSLTLEGKVSLAVLNDGGRSFNQIADLIEKHF